MIEINLLYIFIIDVLYILLCDRNTYSKFNVSDKFIYNNLSSISYS